MSPRMRAPKSSCRRRPGATAALERSTEGERTEEGEIISISISTRMEGETTKQQQRSKPGTVMRVVHGDEEGRRRVEKVAVPETRRPDTLRYVERKLWEKGLHRMERHPVHGGHGPPKSGHGGKYTWEGPVDLVHAELDPAPAAIDEGDPNYVVELSPAGGGGGGGGGGGRGGGEGGAHDRPEAAAVGEEDDQEEDSGGTQGLCSGRGGGGQGGQS